ncbi:hypothetical protein KM427_18255 [Nocardioides sp. LMS-CY]|uniref:Uncharacterized protein n=1 Tax=Nocardioides soli TaxID=1036020 RepID=A0A7W4VXZ9_9ACTN|nr:MULTISPECIES: hypothetical protein [Nocardioides]MBB3043603.1 hypothetical protein [Nocardioides soli]QWF20889.1 hypothetical protein KM427_18255 [Nocardioides sp. LMS-CY]
MAIRVDDISVIHSDHRVVPRAADLADAYLRALARYVQEVGPPVTMRLRTVRTGRGRSRSKRRCLILRPRRPRLRRYQTAHWAVPRGAALDIGYCLLGGEYVAGRDLGPIRFDAPSEADVSEIFAIVEMVEDYAVVPALHEVVAAVTPGGPPGGRGFLDT